LNYIWIILWLLVGLWSATLRRQRTLWGILLHALLGPFGILIFALTPAKKGPASHKEGGKSESGETEKKDPE
jgi:hypothetical protein